MVVPIRKHKTDNVIALSIVNGKLVRKSEIKRNKDGTVDKRHCNRVSGVSSEVYPFTTKEEIKLMIDLFDKRISEASNENKRQIACRNKMLFLVGINLSLRASDLVNLKYDFFLKEDGTFKDFYSLQPKKTKKTKKFVKLFFNETVKKAITDYSNQYPIKDMNEYLFKSRKGDKPITERGLWRIIVDATKEAGIDKNVGSHTLRKTFGFWVWHNAEDKSKALVTLQAIYNHSSQSTTMKYIGLMDNEIEDVFNNLDLGLDYI